MIQVVCFSGLPGIWASYLCGHEHNSVLLQSGMAYGRVFFNVTCLMQVGSSRNYIRTVSHKKFLSLLVFFGLRMKFPCQL